MSAVGVQLGTSVAFHECKRRHLMKKFALIAVAVAFAACARTETESGGEVVDTLNTPNLEGLTAPADTLSVPGDSTDTLRKPFGRKPVDMKDSTRRP
jgi:hypothetical protein